LAGSPSQSAKPAEQVYAQAPAEHAAVALVRGEHAVPQAPQFARSRVVSTSQPLPALASQSAKPALQLATPHAPAAHDPDALAGAQAIPQPPQWARLVRVSASQPFVAVASQSAKPAAQPATPHAPAAHDPVAFAGAQPIPQPPQWARLVAVSTSQPFAALVSQSRNDPAQLATPHAPAAHDPVALAGAQAIPQPPQWARVALVSTSQPSAGVALQSA
jgi:hypothetical protein